MYVYYRSETDFKAFYFFVDFLQSLMAVEGRLSPLLCRKKPYLLGRKMAVWSQGILERVNRLELCTIKFFFSYVFKHIRSSSTSVITRIATLIVLDVQHVCLLSIGNWFLRPFTFSWIFLQSLMAVEGRLSPLLCRKKAYLLGRKMEVWSQGISERVNRLELFLVASTTQCKECLSEQLFGLLTSTFADQPFIFKKFTVLFSLIYAISNGYVML